MAGRITALKIQKRDKGRVNVFLDDEYAFPVSLDAALELKKGQELTDAEIDALKNADAYSKAYNAALHFLSFRQRSQLEVEKRLAKKEYSEPVIAATVERLLDKGYLNDEEFARMWLADRNRFKPRAARALRFELRQKGIANEIIDLILVDLDEEEAAWQAIQPKLDRWRMLDEADFKKKASGFLGRRGFGYHIVRTVFDRIEEESNEELD